MICDGHVDWKTVLSGAEPSGLSCWSVRMEGKGTRNIKVAASQEQKWEMKCMEYTEVHFSDFKEPI